MVIDIDLCVEYPLAPVVCIDNGALNRAAGRIGTLVYFLPVLPVTALLDRAVILVPDGIGCPNIQPVIDFAIIKGHQFRIDMAVAINTDQFSTAPMDRGAHLDARLCMEVQDIFLEDLHLGTDSGTYRHLAGKTHRKTALKCRNISGSVVRNLNTDGTIDIVIHLEFALSGSHQADLYHSAQAISTYQRHSTQSDFLEKRASVVIILAGIKTFANVDVYGDVVLQLEIGVFHIN